MKSPGAWALFAFQCAMWGAAVVYYALLTEPLPHWTAASLASACLFFTAIRPTQSRQDERLGRVLAITEAMKVIGAAADELEDPGERLKLRLLAVEVGRLTDKEPDR